MGPPRPRVGTLAGGRGVGAGRGAGGARGVGRHGWRMASLLSTLPLPLVTAPPPPPGPLPALAGDRPRRGLPGLPSPGSPRPPAFGAHPGPRPRGHPCRRGFACRGCARASCPSRGFGPEAPSRARGPGLSLDRAFPSPSLARPLSRYSAPPRARVRSPPPVGRVRHKGSCAFTPISRLCLPLLLAHSMTFCPHCERVSFASTGNK